MGMYGGTKRAAKSAARDGALGTGAVADIRAAAWPALGWIGFDVAVSDDDPAKG
jgi:hypothetical protein